MWQRTGTLVFSNWMGRFVAILVRNVPGPQIKKSQNCLEIGEWVGGTWWSGIIFSKKEISYLVFNRSHACKLGELCMNVDKVVCTNLVGKCEHGI